MSLLKESETINHSTMRRNRAADSLKRTAKVSKTDFAQMGPTQALVNQQSFAEDFLLEHSASSLHLIKFEISGKPARSTQDPSELSQLFGFPS